MRVISTSVILSVACGCAGLPDVGANGAPATSLSVAVSGGTGAGTVQSFAVSTPDPKLAVTGSIPGPVASVVVGVEGALALVAEGADAGTATSRTLIVNDSGSGAFTSSLPIQPLHNGGLSVLTASSGGVIATRTVEVTPIAATIEDCPAGESSCVTPVVPLPAADTVRSGTRSLALALKTPTVATGVGDSTWFVVTLPKAPGGTSWKAIIAPKGPAHIAGAASDGRLTVPLAADAQKLFVRLVLDGTEPATITSAIDVAEPNLGSVTTALPAVTGFARIDSFGKSGDKSLFGVLVCSTLRAGSVSAAVKVGAVLDNSPSILKDRGDCPEPFASSVYFVWEGADDTLVDWQLTGAGGQVLAQQLLRMFVP